MSRTTVPEPRDPAEVLIAPVAEVIGAPAAASPGGAPGASTGKKQAPIIVRAENLSKRFKIYRKPLHRLREWVFGGKHHTEFWAVKDVNFEVRRGECMGIIGANGSGKSTLLKMISGALQPTTGSFVVQGRVLSLIELGTGLNPLLPGRANIVHAATLLGFPATFAREKMREIEEFAELGEFFERPVMLYSSGMRVRLAFSMFACFRPELFIVDEALSVGDIFFQQKCATRIRELLDGGMTMLFVSHDQSAILNLCDRAMVMDHGSPIFYGEPEEAVTRYVASLRTEGRVKGKWDRKEEKDAGPRRSEIEDVVNALGAGDDAAASGARRSGGGPARQIIARDVIGDRRKARHGNGKIRILACRITSADGRDTLRAAMGDVLTFQVLLEAAEEVEFPRAGIRFFDRFNNLVFGAGTFQHHHPLPPMKIGDRLIVRFDVKVDVAPGQYTFGLGAGEPASDSPQDGVALDRLDLLGPITVGNPADGHRPFYGTARLPMKVSHKVAEGREHKE
jgi:lipopolysaccharide transport system ATP-binding protein